MRGDRQKKVPVKLILWGVLALFIISIFLIVGPYYTFATQDLKISLFRTLFTSGGLRKVNNQVSILVLGIAGGTHDGPTLSDSIIVANYNFEKNRLLTIGIPRDVWSSTLRDKINSAYAYGEAKKENGGLTLAKAEAGAIVGFPIEYAVVINFSKYKGLIDFFGGVNVNVQRSFVDHKYPLEGKEDDPCGGDPDYKCRYETIQFNQGLQHMDGTTALKFVRSRNAIGAEGSDFARSKRQQLVTEDLKSKILATLFSLNVDKTKKLYLELNDAVQRDIENQQVASLIKNVVFKGHFYQKDFAYPRELFVTPDVSLYDGRYVLIPKNGYQNLHEYTQCILSKERDSACAYLEKN